MQAQIAERVKRLEQLHRIAALVKANPRPALNGLDVKLEKYLDFDDGFFIEAGANDGYSQSNTFYYEYARNWSGVLVEAVPELYRSCVATRIRSKAFNCALVADDFAEKSVTMRFAGLMSLVDGAFGSGERETEHIERGLEVQNIGRTYEVEVPARTLTSILDEVKPPRIDLLSLDVEGYEANVLRGLDLDRYRPTHILIEARFRDEIEARIGGVYEAIDELTGGWDVLYKVRKGCES